MSVGRDQGGMRHLILSHLKQGGTCKCSPFESERSQGRGAGNAPSSDKGGARLRLQSDPQCEDAATPGSSDTDLLSQDVAENIFLLRLTMEN